jgi:hypothetical protein
MRQGTSGQPSDSAMEDRTAWLAYGMIDLLRSGLLRHPK